MIAYQDVMVSAHTQCHYSTHHLGGDGAASHMLRAKSENGAKTFASVQSSQLIT